MILNLENVTIAEDTMIAEIQNFQSAKEKNAKLIKKEVRGGGETGRGRRSLAIWKRRHFSAFAWPKQFTSTQSQHTRYRYSLLWTYSDIHNIRRRHYCQGPLRIF